MVGDPCFSKNLSQGSHFHLLQVLLVLARGQRNCLTSGQLEGASDPLKDIWLFERGVLVF